MLVIVILFDVLLFWWMKSRHLLEIKPCFLNHQIKLVVSVTDSVSQSLAWWLWGILLSFHRWISGRSWWRFSFWLAVLFVRNSIMRSILVDVCFICVKFVNKFLKLLCMVFQLYTLPPFYFFLFEFLFESSYLDFGPFMAMQLKIIIVIFFNSS